MADEERASVDDTHIRETSPAESGNTETEVKSSEALDSNDQATDELELDKEPEPRQDNNVEPSSPEEVAEEPLKEDSPALEESEPQIEEESVREETSPAEPEVEIEEGPELVAAEEPEVIEYLEESPRRITEESPEYIEEEITEELEISKPVEEQITGAESQQPAPVPVEVEPQQAASVEAESQPVVGAEERAQSRLTPHDGSKISSSGLLSHERSPVGFGVERKSADRSSAEKKILVSSGEIRVPNLKAQLNSAIKEIEEHVQEEQQQKEEEEEERIYEERIINGKVCHTWRPKGKYDIEHTPIYREDVVPVRVGDVPEPAPFEVVGDEDLGGEGETGYMEYQDDGTGTTLICQTLPNGVPASPIEIPAGIPLLARILPKEEDGNREKIPLERLFTPATDSGEITPKKKRAYASSDFYAPDHPTIDDQLQLAQKISGSLADQNNKTSRGQAMYEKRKQRSEKWVHQEGGKHLMQTFESFQAHSSETFSSSETQIKNKPATKLVSNPKGVQDHTTVEQHYEQLMQESHNYLPSLSTAPSSAPSIHIPASPEIAKDIINDMQSPSGKGAALFAKRKKRMDKFIVDETNVQKTSAYQQHGVMDQSFSSFTPTPVPAPAAVPTPKYTAPPGSKKRLQQERDAEQQKIMSEFLTKRESELTLVKSPWEAALEGNTSAAFKKNTVSMQSSSSSVSSVAFLEGPKAVPLSAAPATGVSSLPNQPSAFARPSANAAPSPAFKPVSPAASFTPAAAPVPAVAPAAAASFTAPAASFAAPAAAPAASFAAPAAKPAAAFTPRATASLSAQAEDNRKSMNFNQAASGWGTYNAFYRPTSFASS